MSWAAALAEERSLHFHRRVERQIVLPLLAQISAVRFSCADRYYADIILGRKYASDVQSAPCPVWPRLLDASSRGAGRGGQDGARTAAAAGPIYGCLAGGSACSESAAASNADSGRACANSLSGPVEMDSLIVRSQSGFRMVLAFDAVLP